MVDLFLCFVFCKGKNNLVRLFLACGIIKVNSPFGKQLKLSEIKEIKTFAGDYTLKTAEKELKINTQIIDPKLLTELNAELKKLDVEWNSNVFR